MKQLVIVGLLATLLAFSSNAQSRIDAEGMADGKTVLWFSGTKVTALIESDLSFAGSLDIDGASVHFTALGAAVGEGVGDSAAMTLDVWLLFDVTGGTNDGVPIELRGAMVGSSEDTDLSSSALGSAAGPFLVLVALGADTYLAVGTAEGSAAGTFVVPDDPLTMQMEGTGTYALAGDLILLDDSVERTDPLGYAPWDAAVWPVNLYAELLALFEGTRCSSDDGPPSEPAGD